MFKWCPDPHSGTLIVQVILYSIYYTVYSKKYLLYSIYYTVQCIVVVLAVLVVLAVVVEAVGIGIVEYIV